MSFLRNTNELKIEVLRKCGELTDGTSPYDADATDYLNTLYQDVLAGGNVFGMEVAEPWVWAQAKRPILLTLQPVFSGAATLTQGINQGVFSVAPDDSLAGRYFRVSARADLYRIATHTAGATAFTLDQGYLAESGTLNYDAFKLDYDAYDDTIIVDSLNNKIDFRENASVTLTATLTSGVYTPTTLCAEIKTQMEVAGAETYTITFNSITRKFNVAHGGAYLDLYFASGDNVSVSTSEVLGYDLKDYTDATSYAASYALSSITRITKPITMYREAPAYTSANKDSGKIFMVDDNTFLRDYPLNRLQQQMPDKFCICEQSPQGLWKLRFNGSVIEEEVRAELNYIPVTRKLVDNESSYPKIPGSHANFLIYGAAHFIMLDKSDSKADIFKTLAATQLQALVNENRKGLSLGGNSYGRLIPRQGQARTWGWSK